MDELIAQRLVRSGPRRGATAGNSFDIPVVSPRK
jgi:hypothetical protein